MSIVSPTPMGGSQFTTLGRRTSTRQALRRPPSRQQLSHRPTSDSNPIGSSRATDSNLQGGAQKYVNDNDSSDEEIPVPMKLSALTKALLDDGGPSAAAANAAQPAAIPTRNMSYLDRGLEHKDSEREVSTLRESRRNVRAGSAQLTSSPNRGVEPSSAPRKRVVRLSSTNVSVNTTPGGSSLQSKVRRSSTHKRAPSKDRTDERNKVSGPEPVVSQDSTAAADSGAGINTPVSGARRVRIVSNSSATRGRTHGSALRSSSSAGTSRLPSSAAHSDHEQPEEPRTEHRTRTSLNNSSGANTARKPDDAAPQSLMRMKRIGQLPGSFLSGPARRGRRRQSDEEENAPADEQYPDQYMHGLREHEPESIARHQPGSGAGSSFRLSSYRDQAAASGSPVSIKDPARAALRNKTSPGSSAKTDAETNKENVPPEEAHEPAPVFQPVLPSALDQENAVSAAVARSKEVISMHEKLASRDPAPLPQVQAPVIPKQRAPSPDRKVLSHMSRNTPLRPAPPPPPKMSVLDAVTSTAGAATTAQAIKKQRVLLKVNGRAYNRLDCIGRGGSAKVYRVTAENGKMFALKRVSLENADTTAVKGFLGEIELLRRLSGVDRVIQMYDSELNQEKKLLSVLMEMGELDLGDLLKSRHSQEDYKLDTVFVRFIWKEMLECLQSVHACDIVHSDLKPANFVMVKGRLKLIDFGIAGAIQTDETVNVHRENQIGTPNYMSPESLMDSAHYSATAANNGRPDRSLNRTRVMKLGKPSDVWSLGCILYQLVYGTPPFGHIPNQLARCQAIIAWDHKISFPEKGAGGVFVPPSLVRTMKRCLIRDQQYRPTCEELLTETDPFLYPQEVDMDRVLPMTEELLTRVIHSVVNRCRDRMPTDGELMTAWPNAYWASVKKSVGSKEARS
ncbi:hypothetical protein M0657_003524 [Pyricularia oryzae]|uniref:Protein kinase domain-containing protein n=2 Tax=Pyricularia oryzae TaxID=318829 RepID=A0AA97PG25_PYRO3|nr:hypothetical protein OOU_Y34scaffold00979g55 [Pyricularia oryzae Y34]KAI7919406.1 hypothetical protein M9X92_006410 [Pyricularia oryzae]KAI7926947.1 hypothetical protein M0657_003524 [Pyricularia oryzae]